MTPVSLYALCVLSGICIWAGFNHLQITFGRPDQRLHQLFALMCITSAAGALCTLSLRWAQTPDEVITRLRWVIAIACVLGTLSPWMVAAYTKANSRQLPLLLSALYGGFFVANLVLANGLWLSDPPPPQSFQLAPAARMAALIHPVTGWRLAWWSTQILTFGYVLVRCTEQYRRGEKHRAIALAVSCALLMGSLINNILISLGISPLPFLSHFGFLALILLMSLTLARELRQSDQRMRTILDLVPALTYVKDRSGRLLFANRHLQKFCASSEASAPASAQLMESRIFDSAWQAHDALVFDEQQPRSFEETLQHDGVLRSYLSLKFPLTDRHGRTSAIGSVSTDITEQKRTQHALALSEAQLRLLIDSTEQGLLGIDLHGRCTLVNRTCLRMVGYDDTRALLGRRVARLLLQLGPSLTQSRQVLDAIRRALQHGERSHSAELKCYRRDGSWFHAEYWCQPILNNGKIEGAVVSVLDITERKRVADAIRALAQASATQNSDAFFQHCVRCLAEVYGVRYAVIGLIDSAKTRLRTKAIWAGYRIVENREFELAHSPCEDVANLSRRVISEGVAQLYPNDALLAKAKIESYFVTPILASSGETIGALVLLGEHALQVGPASESIIDIFAHRISAELERKAALDAVSELNTTLERRVIERTLELSQSNDELEAFSYSVSHDLRAPLTAIHGFGSLLLKHYTGVLDSSGAGYLHRIVEGAHRMGELIDGLLALAQISRQSLQPDRVDLATIATESVRQLEESDAGRHIQVAIAPTLPVTGDRRLLQVLMHNLIENAWKYTAQTSNAFVELGRHELAGEYVFYVRDNGIGFDPVDSERLFQPFRRLHNRKEFPGMGIGLATVARIVRRHGGRIWAESLPNRGATFYFTLPEASQSTPSRTIEIQRDLDATFP